MSKKVIILILCIINGLACSSQSTQADSVFFKAMKRISPSVSFHRTNLDKEGFILMALRNEEISQVSWTSFDEEYIVGLSQNVFEQDFSSSIGEPRTLNIIVFSKKTEKLLVLAHVSESGISCMRYVGMMEVIPYLNKYILFDKELNNEGKLYLQFHAPKLKFEYTYFRKNGTGWQEASFKVPQLEEYANAPQRIVTYEGFKKFIDLIFYIAENRPKDLKWAKNINKGFYGDYVEKNRK